MNFKIPYFYLHIFLLNFYIFGFWILFPVQTNAQDISTTDQPALTSPMATNQPAPTSTMVTNQPAEAMTKSLTVVETTSSPETNDQNVTVSPKCGNFNPQNVPKSHDGSKKSNQAVSLIQALLSTQNSQFDISQLRELVKLLSSLLSQIPTQSPGDFGQDQQEFQFPQLFPGQFPMENFQMAKDQTENLSREVRQADAHAKVLNDLLCTAIDNNENESEPETKTGPQTKPGPGTKPEPEIQPETKPGPQTRPGTGITSAKNGVNEDKINKIFPLLLQSLAAIAGNGNILNFALSRIFMGSLLPTILPFGRKRRQAKEFMDYIEDCRLAAEMLQPSIQSATRHVIQAGRKINCYLTARHVPKFVCPAEEAQ